jgi:hypothetical protein
VGQGVRIRELEQLGPARGWDWFGAAHRDSLALKRVFQ